MANKKRQTNKQNKREHEIQVDDRQAHEHAESAVWQFKNERIFKLEIKITMHVQ